jgi:regulatory protein
MNVAEVEANVEADIEADPQSPDDVDAPEQGVGAARSGVPKPSNRALVSAALKLLARRDMTRTEFVSKLQSREFTAEEAAQAADWCAAEGWLDESRYAEVNARRLGQKYGASRVAHQLRQKGVNAGDLSEVVDALKLTERARARALWQRRFGEPPTSVLEMQRQLRYLQSRGFSYEIAKSAIKKDGSADD